MSKRILIFSLTYFPKYVGGAEIAIKEITDRIDPGDVSFDIITTRFDSNLAKEERIGNVMIYRLGFGKRNAMITETFSFYFYLAKILFVPLAALKAFQLHRKERYDAFWSMMCYMVFPVVLLRLIGIRVPYVLTLQEGDPFEYVFERWYIRIFSPLLSVGFRHASIVQTISTFLADWAREMMFTGPVEVVPNAVNTKHFSQTYPSGELAELKRELGKKDGERYVITTSRLVHKNAVDVVIRAMKFLPDSVSFLILGIGPDEEMLKRLAQEEGVAKRVRFLGQIEHAVLPKYLKTSDVFTRPSRSEGMGNSFVEAMAAEIPVVATREGGITDFLFDPEKNPDREPTGLIAKTNNPEDIAFQIRRMLEDRELRDRCVANAKTLVMTSYDWDLIAKNMRERVFARVLSR